MTKNQKLVLNALDRSDGPLSAYSILDQVREEGIRAPLQVYRALEKLIDAGIVHRLESLNAFVTCHAPGCHGHELAAFAICSECGSVKELPDDDLLARLSKLARHASFELHEATIELRGCCRYCSA